VVGDDELYETYREAIARPDFDPSWNDLIDLTAVARIAVTPDGLRRVAELVAPLDRLGIPSKLAILAPREELYAAASLYERMRAGVARRIRVFRDRNAALEWLAER